MSRNAIVTGGTEAGAAAVRLAEMGLDVAILCPDESAHSDTERQISLLDRRSVVIGTDITDPAAVDAALAEVCHTLGDPEVLVNVVSATDPGPLCELSEADWYASSAHHFRGVFLVSRAAVDPMTKLGHGRIITICPYGNETVRTGLEGFTRTIALELEPFGITAELGTSLDVITKP